MKSILILTGFLFLLGSCCIFSTPPNGLREYKYNLDIPLTEEMKSFISSSNNKCAYDSYLQKIFFREALSSKNYNELNNIFLDKKNRKTIDNFYRSSNYSGEGWGQILLAAPLAANPIVGEAISLYGILSGGSEKPVVSIAGRNTKGKAYAYKKTNEQCVWQPMALINAAFLATNFTNPWLCLAGNGLAFFTFSQNSPLPAYEAKAFPCSTFDKALYDSSLMSEELWAEFKLAGYYNDNDQLNDKFFQDYKDKKLLISENFKPYEAGIYEAFDTYLKEKNTEKSPTPTINLPQGQPLSAILPQSK